ncbi:MAG TPA: hypothetical protein VJR27_01600 [Candidatus Saccharimonadales bacterium]|nr:hypothetical protein [Candidatus Saccharimonadales bacterium]
MQSVSKITRKVHLVVAALLFGLVFSSAWPASAHAEANVAADETTTVADTKVAVGDVNAEATPAADPIITCGPAPRDKDSSRWGRYFRVNGVNIRRSPSTHSTVCAQGQKSHLVDYHCWTVGSDGYTWTYLRDATTHYAGWVRDNLLVGHGSLVHC